MTNADFVIATIATADVEGAVGSIAVTPSKHIKKILLASRLGVGMCYQVRLDFIGITTPQKYTFPMGYDPKGTETDTYGVVDGGENEVEVDIPIPSNTTSVTIYATCDTTNTKVAVGLEWA